MILQLSSLTSEEYYERTAEYFDSWGIPAGITGRLDGGNLEYSTANLEYKGNTPDNKIVAITTKKVQGKDDEFFTILLRKDAKDCILSFDMYLPNNGKQIWGKCRFISENEIDINIHNTEVLDMLASC